ncbi:MULTISPECIES: ANTAR domain-containing protein [Nocardioides]|uniref:ANTAR domain-containing protein n=1 Tax=Nocardioides vastitatis TaxID=2568655 RepID=A0ABW0ZS51_9ACTN|nr:ANTAR domain-containing protein [Nocardioides sp.]THI94375.1 GAF and ANTAR domain-containing protein [Nocardioides sp.]
MTRTPSHDSFAGSSAALVQDYDLTGRLVQTVSEAADHLGAAAAGLLVTNRAGELELLSATSHVAAALETYQALSGEGPCQECMRQEASVSFGLAEVTERWRPLAELMEAAGYTDIIAAPLRWRGTTLGGLNLFWTGLPGEVRELEVEAQVYGDILTLFIINSDPVSPGAARERLENALAGRAVIEQAKGVLAEQRALDLGDAYRQLLELEKETGQPLTEVARSLIRAAQEPGSRSRSVSR